MGVTLSEVARHAGVSPATASRALNGSARAVGQELADRVRASAAELGYLPNAAAQALARSTTAHVGLLLPDIGDPAGAAIARGVSGAAAAAGLLPLLVETDGDPDAQLRGILALRGQRVRAVVLAGSAFTDPAAARAIDAALAAYRADGGRVAGITEQGAEHACVLPESEAGAAALARTMAGLGHRRFAVIAGPRRYRVSADRLAGVRSALTEAGIGLGPQDVRHAEPTRAGGRRAIADLLDGRPVERWPSCVLALADLCATGVLAELRERGVPVPGRISVAGFEDLPSAADLVPALTTVRLPLEQLGSEAVRLALADPPPGVAPARLRLPARVVLRASTGAPPR
ncbi:LacI family DNA-binding transcriptional regulator [Kitasatospora sp. LaBMicrA B282]|uniref:LacI family DNA-binding transcriptional regulator n=1 Tax=Kitasatospora sp. LaBMicrA B282 TaxID=3420949 RepID=UPI003D140D0B